MYLLLRNLAIKIYITFNRIMISAFLLSSHFISLRHKAECQSTLFFLYTLCVYKRLCAIIMLFYLKVVYTKRGLQKLYQMLNLFVYLHLWLNINARFMIVNYCNTLLNITLPSKHNKWFYHILWKLQPIVLLHCLPTKNCKNLIFKRRKKYLSIELFPVQSKYFIIKLKLDKKGMYFKHNDNILCLWGWNNLRFNILWKVTCSR